MWIYCLLILRDFTFIEHHFFDKIAILTKLSAKISLKLLQSPYNNTLSRHVPNSRQNQPATLRFVSAGYFCDFVRQIIFFLYRGRYGFTVALW